MPSVSTGSVPTDSLAAEARSFIARVDTPQGAPLQYPGTQQPAGFLREGVACCNLVRENTDGKVRIPCRSPDLGEEVLRE